MADILSRSNQVQSTEWSLHPQLFKQICQVVHSSCRSICLSVGTTEFHCTYLQSQTKICSKHKLFGLTADAYPPMALLHRVIHVRQCNCLIIVITPGWPWTPWFWDLVQLSTEIPLQVPVSTTLLILSHNYVFIVLIHPIQWTIVNPVGADQPAKRQKKTSCVSTGWPVPVLCTRKVAHRTSLLSRQHDVIASFSFVACTVQTCFLPRVLKEKVWIMTDF